MKFKLLTSKLLNKLHRDVYQFRTTYGLPVGNNYHFLTDEECELHTSLIVEEMTELCDARNFVDQVDAIVDSVYVLVGRNVHDFGNIEMTEDHINVMETSYIIDILLQVAERKGFDFIACWDEVHRSNMSKGCHTMEEAEVTCDWYARNRDLDTTIHSINGMYIVKCAHDPKGEVKRGKLLKSINYSEADLRAIALG